MDVNNLTNVYNQNPTIQGSYTLQQYLDLFGGSSTPANTNTNTNTSTTTTPTTTNAGQGIINANINQYQSGGGGNNPYMPNANVNTNYNSRPAYEAAFGTNLGDPEFNRATGALNSSGVMGDYREKPISATQQFLSKALNYVPYIGTAKRGMEFLGSKLKGVMPVNKRAILENQLRGSGVFTDDIGRITVGPDGKYNTPEGIMAGYSANQMTDKTFDKRTGNITNSLIDRTSKAGLNISKADLQAIVNEIATTGKYSGELTDEDLGVKNLFSNLVNVNMAKFNFKNTKTKQQKIIDFQNKEREKKKKEKEAANRARRKAAAQIERAKKGQAPRDPGDRGRDDTPGFGKTAQGNYTNQFQGGDPGLMADGGLMGRGGSRRKSYFDGGIVSLRRR